MTAKRDCDVIIVGGGLSGPVLALALAQAGLEVYVLDAEPRTNLIRDDFDGRAYALSYTSCRMLQVLGLWQDVAAAVQPINDIRIRDAQQRRISGRWSLHFDGAEMDAGPMGHIIEDRFLRSALLRAMEAHDGIRCHHGAQVISQILVPGGIDVEIASGVGFSASLLIGCDGRRSSTARRAGIVRQGWGYDQSALVCALAHDSPHNGTACQVFWPSGPLAVLPLPGDRCSIVWTEKTARAEWISKLSEADYLDVLRPLVEDILGPCRLVGGRYCYSLGLNVAESFVADRVALAGDAAHGIHPLAGQGLNLGLRDVASLAEVLVYARRRGQDPGAPEVLAQYQRWRRFDTATLSLATDGLNRLFSNDNPILGVGRRLGLALVNKMPAARRAMIREAAGLSGDLPALLRGQPI